MTDDERSPDPTRDTTDASAGQDEEDGGSPFDHPAFLPVLLWALAIWFGYDGWLNRDPDMAEHLTFNRVGFGVLVLAGTYYTVQSLRGK
jgi:hypothetical protein